RGARCAGRPRSSERVDRAQRNRRDGPPCDGTRRGKRCSHSVMLLAVVPKPGPSFRLLTLACRYGMLDGGDWYNKRLRGAAEGHTVGLGTRPVFQRLTPLVNSGSARRAPAAL